MLTCQQATQLLSERQDRPLQRGEKFSLALHTTVCTACRRFGVQMTQLSQLSKHYRDSSVLDLEASTAHKPAQDQ